jgi:eukaryotic-like serine/threonine-protein kinase
MQKICWAIYLSLLVLSLTACIPQVTATQAPLPTITSSPIPMPDQYIVLFRANPQRTGVYSFPAMRTQPEVKWQTKVSNTWLMPPLLADGILYTGSGDGVLYAVDAETGEQLWSDPSFGQLESTGAIAGDTIITAGYNQLVKAMDRITGEERWTYTTEYGVQGAPLIVQDRVYIATDHRVYALDLESGELIWKAATGTEGAYMGAPAYEDGVIYTTGGKLLLALEAESGKELWRTQKDEMFLGPTVANGMVYVGNFDRKLYAFDQANGEEKWSFDGEEVFWSSPAASEDVIYAGNDRTVYALDAQTGELLWSFDAESRSTSEPLISDGVVYVSDSSHEFPRGPRHLYALVAKTGELLWEFETMSTFLPAPALGEGVVYVTSTGEIIALQ